MREQEVPDNGEQLLSGDQVAAYCYIEGTGNTVRQLQVVKAIDEKVGQVDREVLKAAFEACLDDTVTTVTCDDLDQLAESFGNYRIVGEGIFPYTDMSESAVLDSNGKCNVPVVLEDNIVRLHQFLFNRQDYAVSDTVKMYGKQITENASPYLKK